MPFPFTFPFAFDYKGQWLDGWTHRIKLAIDHTKFDSSQTHFPMLIHLSASCGASSQDMSRVFDEVGANSLKIAVTTEDGEELYVEVEKWDNGNEEAWLWVSKSGWSISSTGDTILYLYYDNDHADNSTYVGAPNSTPAENVWDSYFKFVSHMQDDPDTSHIRDSTGNDLDGTKKGANEPRETNRNVLHFDGSIASNINCGAIHNAAAKLWVDFWFKLDDDFDSGVAGTQFLFGKYLGADDWLTLELIGNDGRMRFWKRDGGGNSFAEATIQNSWNGGQWYHVLFSISSANGMRWIIDGGTPITDADTSALCDGANFIIGDVTDPGNGSGFKGVIANVVVGTDDLSEAEEAALYAGTAPGDEVNYWYADEGTGTNIVDYGSGGNNGTADTNTSWQTLSAESPPVRYDGKLGDAQDFDGLDDYINLGNNAELNFTTSDFTIEAWIKPTASGVQYSIFTKGYPGAAGRGYEFYLSDNTRLWLCTHQAGASQYAYGNVRTWLNQWYHVVCVRDGATGRIYVDGADDKDAGINLVDPATSAVEEIIGAYYSKAHLFLDGLIDEVRVSAAARSAAWIKASYESERDNLVSFTIEGYPDPEHRVRIAFPADPLADSPTWNDVSSDLISFSPKRGRQHQLDRFEAGVATILLDNEAGNYWPKKTDGEHYPFVKLRRRVNIRSIYNGTLYDLYTGFVTRWKPGWLVPEAQLHPVMTLSCADAQRLIARKKLNDAAGYAEEASGTRVGNVLDDVGFPSADRSIDAGKENVQATGPLSDVNAMEHLFKAQESELSAFFLRGDGHTIYQERGARNVSPYDTSQATFGDGGLPIHAIEFSLDDDLLYNEIRLTRTGGSEQTYSDSESQDDYGISTLNKSGLLLTSDSIVYLYCLYYLARHHDVKLRIKSITIKPQTTGHQSTLWPIALGYELSTRITVVIDEADINDEYFIEGIEHSYDYREGLWVTKFQLSDASQQLYTPDATEATLRPEGAGDITQLTPFPDGGEANWEDVDDETPDEDSTYVEAAPTGDRLIDLYAIPGLPTSSLTINSVKIYIRCRCTNAAPTGLLANTAIKTGGATYYGDDEDLTNSWTNYSKTYALNPDTGVAWTYDEVAALQIGLKIQSNVPAFNDKGQCTQVYAVVNYIPTW